MALQEVQIELSNAATGARSQVNAQSSDLKSKENYESKAKALEKLESNSGNTVRNSTRPPWFKSKGEHDPSLVKIALGSVLIVGDEIAYLQRVQIQNTGTTASAATAAPISVAITPKPGTATQGGDNVVFTAAVSNDPSNVGVNWTLDGTGCAVPACGSFASSTANTVTYKPPANAPNPNTVTLTATSRADATKSDSVTITIN